MTTPNEDLQVILRRTMGRLMSLSMRGFWHYAKTQGLSIPQMIALRQVYYHGKKGGCNVSDIGENLGVTNAAASQSIDKLVKMKLVSRLENPKDRRNKQLLLTESGEQILSESMRSSQIWLKDLQENLTPEEAARITQALTLLADKLQEIE